MENIIRYANAYAKQSDWKDFALLKLCVGAIGLLLGLCIPKRKREPVAFWATVLMAVTLVPLMIRFFRAVLTVERTE